MPMTPRIFFASSVSMTSIRPFAMALVMNYPGLARRAVPMLLRHFEAAA